MHLGRGLKDHQLIDLSARSKRRNVVSYLPCRFRRQEVCAARAGTAEPDVSRQAAPGHAGCDTSAGQPKGTAPSTQTLKTARAPKPSAQPRIKLPMAGFNKSFRATYKLGQPLGSGSFKTVFVGRHRASGQRVAVQVISKERGGTTPEHNMERIKQEVAITQMLQVRPESCRLYGVYEDERNVYMITEMCDGGTLEQYIQTHQRMPELDAVLVITDVLHVLAECNRQKVCYADIKPANLLLKSRYPDVDTARSPTCPDAPPDVRVIDFGCSQLVKEGTKLDKRTGTPLFLPPEMFMRHWGPEADLWSLGMVSYLLLSGKMPFWEGAMENIPPFMVMQEILGADILFDGPEWEGISDEAIDFVDKLLDRDFNNRMTAEQALQHPWIVSTYPEDLEECYLLWEDDDDDPDYNIMNGGKAGRSPKIISQDGVACPVVACSIDDGPS